LYLQECISRAGGTICNCVEIVSIGEIPYSGEGTAQSILGNMINTARRPSLNRIVRAMILWTNISSINRG
jgi:hypothetical protein